MGTQILKGSKGTWTSPTTKVFKYGKPEFTVTEDTCLDATGCPVLFDGASEAVVISMSRASFSPENGAVFKGC